MVKFIATNKKGWLDTNYSLARSPQLRKNILLSHKHYMTLSDIEKGDVE